MQNGRPPVSGGAAAASLVMRPNAVTRPGWVCPRFLGGGCLNWDLQGHNLVCPRRAAKGQEEHLKPFCPRRTRRGAENTLTLFCPRRTRRGAENTLDPFCPRRTRRGAENTLNPFCPRRTRRGAENTLNPFCPRRTRRDAENTLDPFCPRRTRRDAENTFFHTRRTRRTPFVMLVVWRGVGAGCCGELHSLAMAFIYACGVRWRGVLSGFRGLGGFQDWRRSVDGC